MKDFKVPNKGTVLEATILGLYHQELEDKMQRPEGSYVVVDTHGVGLVYIPLHTPYYHLLNWEETTTIKVVITNDNPGNIDVSPVFRFL